MNSIVFTQIFRFSIFVILQVLVFRQMGYGSELLNHVHVIVYPVFIMLLPIRVAQPVLISLGFLIGIAVDFFYDTPGVHASACVFMAFMRPLILRIVEPRGGYNNNDNPTMEKFGFMWFFIYSSLLLVLHFLFYFSMEIFTPVRTGEILLRTFSSYFPSIVFILAYIGIFKPRE